MRKYIIIIGILFAILIVPTVVKAEQNLGRITVAWFTELWHHSGNYWTGNISKTVYDSEIGPLIKNNHASTKFTNCISEQVTIIRPFTKELNKYLDEGGNIQNIKINLTSDNNKEFVDVYIDGTLDYELDLFNRNLIVKFVPFYRLKSESYYLDFKIPAPYYDCDYIKFSIYHKTTNQLLGVLAAKDGFDYNWIQGKSGELYHPSNPIVKVSNYGVETEYYLNDLKIGNGTFQDGGAVGYFFINSIIFEFLAPDPVEIPDLPEDPPDSTPSLNVYFHATCNDYVATNNPDYPVFVDNYPAYLDLHMDYEIHNNTITMVKLERKSGNNWVLLDQKSIPIYSYRHTTYIEAETFRLTVYSTRMDPVSITISAYTKLKYENEIPFFVDFYLYDKNNRLVNDNYNNPIEVESMPDTLILQNVIPDTDPNFSGVYFSLVGNGKREILKDINYGYNYNVPAKYLTNLYDMHYLYNLVPPMRIPRHYVFFKIVDPELKVSATIEGSINRWDGGTDIHGNVLPKNDHRFLSLEKVKIKVFTDGYADKVIIRFSPELEAMTYRPEGKNYVYDMKKDYGIEYTYFPEDTTFELDSTKRTNEITWEYYLPLAEDTLDWEGRRAKSPYVMTVYAYKGDKCAVYTVDDIEITGTVFDLIHIQPKG
jgi:hypothetical protein